MSGVRCKAITVSGEKCKLKAGSSGYCHIHDPEKIAERETARRAAEEHWKEQRAKGGQLREVIGVVKSTCEAKGWEAHVASQDTENWQYATISVKRSVPYLPETITGLLDISLSDGVRISSQRTSFHGYGLRDLLEAITAELGRLPWLDFPEKTLPTKPPSAIQQIEPLIKRFHIVARQLEHRHDNRETLTIQDEYDAQDLLHALLKTVSDDVRPEEVTPSHAGASSRVDFLLKREKIVVEVKMASSRMKDKQIGEELIVDIKRYQSHPDCGTLICFVYDPNHHLANPAGLEDDLSGKHDDLNVRVLVVPH